MAQPGVVGDTKTRAARRRAPGPSQHPGLLMLRWIRRPLALLEECAARYGDTFELRLMGLPRFVLTSSPEAVREVFAEPGEALHAGEAATFLAPFLGNHSVLLLDGKEHLRKRKLLLPPFQGERMQAYGQAMLDETRRAMRAWPTSPSRPFSIHPSMQELTLRVVVRTVFGVDEGAFFDSLVHRLTELLEIATWPTVMLPQFQVDLGPWSPWGRYLRRAKVVNAMLLEQIAERRRAGTEGRADVLSLLVAAKDEDGRAMSDEEIRSELVTLLVAGHETTATTLAWMFRYLLDAPEEKKKLEDELTRARAQGPLTPERIAKLERLDAVVRETLRLQPVIPLVARLVKRPFMLGDIEVPTGHAIACSIYLAQRRPELYSEPTRFRPERFIGKKLAPNEFFPFGGGIRRCIGLAFAMYEMKMVLATVIGEGDLTLDRAHLPRVARRGITLAPSNGTHVTYRRR